MGHIAYDYGGIIVVVIELWMILMNSCNECMHFLTYLPLLLTQWISL